MSFTTAGDNAAVNGIIAAGHHIGMHTATPDSSGSNEVAGGTYARQASTFPAASGGSSTGSQVNVPIPAATTITHWSLWSAGSGGTCLGSWPLPASETFGSAGTEQFTPTVTAS